MKIQESRPDPKNYVGLSEKKQITDNDAIKIIKEPYQISQVIAIQKFYINKKIYSSKI